jgi:hypothetical protein
MSLITEHLTLTKTAVTVFHARTALYTTTPLVSKKAIYVSFFGRQFKQFKALIGEGELGVLPQRTVWFFSGSY